MLKKPLESNYLISDFRLQQFKDETKSDETLQNLLTHIQNGWFKFKNDLLNLIRNYFIHRQDLTYTNGITFKGIRMIVLKSLLEDIKHLLHIGLLGIVKIKEKSCDILYWPGINADLENNVNSCDTCEEYQNHQKDESPIPHDIPTTPRNKVGTDLFEFKGKSYLVVVDYTTNFF